jgi:hypothetical protein
MTRAATNAGTNEELAVPAAFGGLLRSLRAMSAGATVATVAAATTTKRAAGACVDKLGLWLKCRGSSVTLARVSLTLSHSHTSECPVESAGYNYMVPAALCGLVGCVWGVLTWCGIACGVCAGPVLQHSGMGFVVTALLMIVRVVCGDSQRRD